MRKKVNIIGAGIAGLSAGCYLQMNGYDTEIYELHARPGGLCTAWQRKGFTFENCIHWVVGVNPSDIFYQCWNELLDMKRLEFICPETYMTIHIPEGPCVEVFSNIDKLKGELLRIAPEDMTLIHEFIKAVKKFADFKIPIEKPSEISNLFDNISTIIKILPYYRDLKKWNVITLQDYANQYRNPFLRKTFDILIQHERAATSLIFLFAWFHKRSAAYLVGGSLKLIGEIVNRYLQLGGKINYHSRVEQIITENNAARGIVMENGERYYADIVVSAADGHYTIYKMLDGNYADQEIRELYSQETMPSYILVCLGVSKKLKNEPATLAIILENPLVVDENTKHESIEFRILSMDPTLAPKGKTVITAMLKTFNFEYWKDLRHNDRKRYNLEKSRIANEVIEALDREYGDIKSNIEVVDVSTPATVIRYTNNWKGSHEGWITTPEMGFKNIKKVLPGLKNFYMAGQWVESAGGLPTSVVSGRHAAQIICKEDNKKFVATHF